MSLNNEHNEVEGAQAGASSAAGRAAVSEEWEGEQAEAFEGEAPDVALEAEELAGPAVEIERLQAELKSWQDQLVRHSADFQNYRRRAEEKMSLAIQGGKAEVVERILDVLDDLRRSLEAAEQAAEKEPGSEAFRTLHQGVSLVYKKFTDELTRLGVEPIEAVGRPFHEDEHEALMQQPAPEGVPSGTVLAEVQRGYRMGDRVLRHAKVIVAA